MIWSTNDISEMSLEQAHVVVNKFIFSAQQEKLKKNLQSSILSQEFHAIPPREVVDVLLWLLCEAVSNEFTDLANKNNGIEQDYMYDRTSEAVRIFLERIEALMRLRLGWGDEHAQEEGRS